MTISTNNLNIAKITSLAGQTIGKYRLQEALGAGGMATVYRAVQMPLERPVAVKVLHPHLTAQDSFRDRFLREAKAVASLRHENIVQMYDYDVQDGICYMALEFLDGQSLEDNLVRLAVQTEAHRLCPLPLNQALQIGISVAHALEFAHQQRVIHRDVKPANIMQTTTGRTVLTDFGIATVLHETRLTADGITSGTPSYMSPEQALGERGDERSDIYSLGTVLYQLVTGRLPFEADTLYGLIMMHVNDTPTPASQVNGLVPAVVDNIIHKAMAKKPADRYQTAAEFAADLEAALAGKTIEIKLPASAQTKAAVARWWWAGGAAVVIILAGLAAWFWSNNRPPQLPPVAPQMQPPVAVANPPDIADNQPDFVPSMAANVKPNAPYADNFDNNAAGWPESGPPAARQLLNGEYQISVETPDRATATIPRNLAAYDKFRYKLDATLVDGQPESGYGMVFNYRNGENYYVFAVNGLRQWSIWRLENGRWHELRDLPNNQTWTSSSVVLPAGQPNRLMIEVKGNTFNMFVNDAQLLQLTDSTGPRSGGLVGMYVASSRTAANALARARFDNLDVQPLDEFTTPSMAY